MSLAEFIDGFVATLVCAEYKRRVYGPCFALPQMLALGEVAVIEDAAAALRWLERDRRGVSHNGTPLPCATRRRRGR